MKRSFLTSLCLGAALVVAAMLPQAGWAASVDVNGRVIDKGVEIVKGTTMMDQANLQDVMKLNVKLDKKAFTLKNDDETVIIEGTVGQKSMTVNGKKVSLSAAAIVKDGKLWLPLRPLMETFGTVDWDGSSKRVRAYFDYTAYNKLKDAKEAKNTVKYEIPANSGMGWDESDGYAIDCDETLGVLREVYKNNALVSINNGAGPVIQVVHDTYKISPVDTGHAAYYVDEEALVWQERPAFTPTDQDRIYLYIQARKDGAKPVCVEECAVNNATARINDAFYNNGKLIWSVVEDDKQQVTIKYYDVDTEKTVVLDEISMPNIVKYGFCMAAVSIGDHYAAAVVQVASMDIGDCGDLYRYDLETGEKKAIGRGYNMKKPEIYGDNLMVVATSGGVEMKSESVVVPSDLWCYDLQKDEWRYKVSANLPSLPKGDYQQRTPMRLNDNHLALNLYGADCAYDFTILDVDKGTVAIAENQKGRALRTIGQGSLENALDTEEAVLCDIRPCRKGNVAYATVASVVKDNLQLTVYPIYFEW